MGNAVARPCDKTSRMQIICCTALVAVLPEICCVGKSAEARLVAVQALKEKDRGIETTPRAEGMSVTLNSSCTGFCDSNLSAQISIPAYCTAFEHF